LRQPPHKGAYFKFTLKETRYGVSNYKNEGERCKKDRAAHSAFHHGRRETKKGEGPRDPSRPEKNSKPALPRETAGVRRKVGKPGGTGILRQLKRREGTRVKANVHRISRPTGSLGLPLRGTMFTEPSREERGLTKTYY